MAKSKLLKTVKKPIELAHKEPIAQVIINKVEDSKEPEEITVMGTASAEQLQKSGWQLLDCHRTPKGKEYKFRKVK